MDKSWMQLVNRTSHEYINGVKAFVTFAINHMGNRTTMNCPCYDCNNCRSLPPHVVHEHLIIHGIVKSYDPWVYHGETFYDANDADSLLDANDVVDDNEELVADGAWDILQDLNNDALFNDWATASTSNSIPTDTPVESNMFARLVKDATEALYRGCKVSKFSFIVKLLHIKTISKWSNKSFNMLLALLKDILPSDAQVPSSYYKAKEIIRELGLHCVKIDACVNDCVLFWKDYKDLDACPTCNTPRYQGGLNKEKSVPQKVLRYFPLKPRLQRLYVSSRTANDMRWHQKLRVNDGILRHPADSEAWKHFDKQFPVFASDPRNVRLGLASDGFNPFDNLSNSYSMWPVILVPYNLPPWRCMKDPFFMLSLLIPGPKGPGNDIDVYLEPLVDELKDLWHNGVQTYDASMDKLFQMHAALLWTINDFPAYANLSGWSTKGKLACPVCNIDNDSLYLKHGKKTVYMGHRRFLPIHHKLRTQKNVYGNELRLPPKVLSGDDIIAQLNEVTQPTFGKVPSGSKKRKRAAVKYHWTKRSIFFELPYWKSLKIRHNLDVMHIEKNVCESVLGTIMNIDGKTKDTYKARLDLESMGIMHSLHPIRNDGATYIQPACYMLTDAEKKKFCEFLCNVKLPDGYSSNISRCVNVNDSKVSGLKSHDCHVLLQRLLPIGLRGFLRRDVCKTLIDLCLFFKVLTSRTLKVDVLQQLDRNIPHILSRLEAIFPPSFFDVMLHLSVHLAHETALAGPCQFRWMYPFERYMHKLKAYVRNKARPEGSIVEGYIDNECLTFCSMYLSDVETRFNRPERNDVFDSHNSEELSIFSHKVRGYGKPKFDELNLIEWSKLRWYVLSNCTEVLPYIVEHRQHLERQNVGDISSKHKLEFPRWLLQRLIQLEDEGSNNTNNGLKLLARGPHRSIVRHSGCIIDGHRFRTKGRDLHRKTHNCGVAVKTEHDSGEVIYYGVVNDIIELSYGGSHNLFCFKCDWWDTVRKNRVMVDEFSYVSINVRKTCYEEEPYVLASQVEGVIYLPDTKLGKNWRVVERMPPRNLYDPLVTKFSIDSDEVYQQDECNDDITEDIGKELDLCLTRTDMEKILVGANDGLTEDTNLDNEEWSEEDGDDDGLRGE